MRKGEATRRRIIEQAAPIFNQRGFEGCSLNDLMLATGLKKGGIYRHFASKQELAAEAFRFAASTSVRLHPGGPGQVPGTIATLRHIVQRFVDAPSGMPGGCPLMNTAIDADDGNPELRRLALEAIRAWRSDLSRIVRDGINRLEIDHRVSPDRIANTIISALEGALMISRLEHSRTPLRDAQASLDVLFQSLAATSALPLKG